jgi:glycosyltransferase involved in cell wall biosynthesis
MSGSSGMTSIRRLLVVSTQDSTLLSSWSNVPYLFCQTLEAQGVEVLRLTLKESALLRRTTRIVQKFLELVGMGKSTWSFSRSALYFFQAQRQIDRALGIQEVDGVLVLNLSYGPQLPSKYPLYLFGDWSLAYTIACQRARAPSFLERGSIHRENKLIQSASHVFVLFPLAEKYIKKTLPNANTHYLGNVINAVEQPREQDLSIKRHSLSLLFVGKPHYIEGARQLIEAYQKLKPRFHGISLDIVGIGAGYFPELPVGVVCHGYLDKGDKQQREQYYSLLRKAKLFVNPNPRWASFSAALEAMYFYTPLVTSAYSEMEETFGLDLSFGSYYRGGRSRAIFRHTHSNFIE